MRVDCGFKGHERNASIFIGFPLQMARNQFASNRTRVRIPPSPPKIIILTIEKLKRLATFRLGIKSLIILISKNLIDHRLVHTQVITGRYSLT